MGGVVAPQVTAAVFVPLFPLIAVAAGDGQAQGADGIGGQPLPVAGVNGYRINQGAASFTPTLDGDNGLTELEIRDGAVRYEVASPFR